MESELIDNNKCYRKITTKSITSKKKIGLSMQMLILFSRNAMLCFFYTKMLCLVMQIYNFSF